MALAVIAAAILHLGSELVVEPLAHRIWPQPEHVSNVIESGASGWRQALISLLIIWTFASLGKGPSGVLDSTYSGLVYGAAYLLSGRNLWAAILAHGIADTFAVFVVFMGWAH